MKIIEILKNKNGSHDNITAGYLDDVPKGWAVIPDNMETPNFPFGDVEAEEIDGVMTVTRWAAGVTPEPKPIQKQGESVTAEDIINALTGGVTNE